MTRYALDNQDHSNHQGHSEADCKSGVLAQKRKDGNLEVDENTGSWTLVINHKKNGECTEKIFLDEDKRVKRVITGDRKEISKMREEIKLF